MRRARRVTRALAGLGVAVLSVCSAPLVLAAPAAAADTPSISMTVVRITPNTPVISSTPKPVTFQLNLTNNTTRTLSGVTVEATRSDPIGDQTSLNAAIASPKPPSDTYRSDITDKQGDALNVPVEAIAPGYPQTVVFKTTMGSVQADNPGICACGNLIYPIYFTATSTSTDGTRTELGHAQTYIPSFATQPKKTTVAWVWPLLDRPHRLRQDDLFTDDDLAREISLGGRLDKLLDVLEKVTDEGIPMTVVTDPDLIDSLAVMSTGYRIATHDGIVRGLASEQQNAADWLARLKAVVAHEDVELAFTAYADPAVEALTRADMTWTATASATAQQRIANALGTPGFSDLTWPLNEQVSATTLTTLRSLGTRTVILRDTALTSGTREVAGESDDKNAIQVPADAIAPLSTKSGSVKAAVTSTPIESLVRRILTSSSADAGLPLLPTLVAQLAIRAESSVNHSHFVVITPPRQLNVEDPELAWRTIEATASTTWSTPLPLNDAVQSLAAVSHGTLRANYSPDRTLPGATVRVLRALRATYIPAATDLFADASAAEDQLGTMDVAIQRVESTGLLTQPRNSVFYAGRLRKFVRKITAGVTLAKLYKGSGPNAVYTLASKDATLPVTVVNTLDAAVRIRVTANAKDAESGFSADTTRVHTLAPGQRVQLRLVTHVKRVGQIPIVISLETEGERATGVTQTVTIRSTALGTIGVVITIVAGVVLVLAIVVRGVKRQLYRRRHKPAPAAT